MSRLWNSLWDDSDSDDDDSQSNQKQLEQQPDDSIRELDAIEPAELVSFESNKVNSITDSTAEFAGALRLCDNIVVAAYKVADYTPPFQNDKQSEFWKKTVNPTLIQSLHQHVKARSIITRSFGIVRDLAIVIDRVYEIVRQTKGSKKAIEIAKKHVSAALNKLNECIAQVEKLDSNAVRNFAAQAEEIFNIVGPDAAKFAEEKEELDEKIRQRCDKQHKLISELGKKKGEVESLYYLIKFTEKNVEQTDTDLQEAQKRKSEIIKLNDQIENAIQNIPPKIQKTVIETGGGGWWLWRRTWEKKDTKIVDNPLKDEQERYFNSVIKSRLQRLQANEKDENAKKAAIETLKKEIAGYKEAYETRKEELDNLQKELKGHLAEIQRDIDLDVAAKREIDRKALETWEKIGLQGNTLIAALVQVRIFSRSLEPGASAYSPFAAILNSIKAMVEAEVELLCSDEEANVFIAGKLLIKQVTFLSNYTASAQRIMKPSVDYDQQAITQGMQQQSLTL